MKRRIWIVAVVVVLMMSIFSGAAYGSSSGLNLIETYPEDGQTNTSADNMSIKLYFDQDIDEKVFTVTKDGDREFYTSEHFKLTGPEGEDVPLEVYMNPSDKSEVLVVAKPKDGEAVASNSEYTFQLAAGFSNTIGGATIGSDTEVTYKTLNKNMTMIINVVMMTVMMGAMVFFTKKSMNNPDSASAAVEAFNPYKEAKRTGKSVKEVIEIHEKEMAKKRAKEAKKQKVEIAKAKTHKVKTKRSLAAAGSKYVIKMRKKSNSKKAKNSTGNKNKKK